MSSISASSDLSLSGEDAESVPSPCIRRCCLDGHDICLGCGRSREEIKGWKRLGKGERLALLAEADMRLLALEATGRRKY